MQTALDFSTTTLHPYLMAAKHLFQLEFLQQPIKTMLVTTQTTLGNQLRKILEAKNFQVEWQCETPNHVSELPIHTYGLILIGPTIDNAYDLQLCAKLRLRTLAPIIFLTEVYHIGQLVQAFELGADRVITVPFEAQVLVAHINSLLRRTTWARTIAQTEDLSVGDLYLCHKTRTVKISNRLIELSALDYRLLHYLMQHANNTVSKAALWREIWADRGHRSDPSIATAIRRLRNRIEENPSAPKYLINQYGTGYKLILTCPLSCIQSQ